MNRRESRKNVFELLYEKEFHKEETAEEVYATSTENREIKDNEYIKTVFFGVCENKEKLDEIIFKYAVGWKPERMQKVSLTILRLAIYEMLFMDDIPVNVSVNEAVELSKTYDDENARPFINGILNAVLKSTENKTENE